MKCTIWRKTSVLQQFYFFKVSAKNIFFLTLGIRTIVLFSHALNYNIVKWQKLKKNKYATKEGVFWGDNPSLEFKNNFMVKRLKILTNKINHSLSWKYASPQWCCGCQIGNCKATCPAKEDWTRWDQLTVNFVEIASA